MKGAGERQVKRRKFKSDTSNLRWTKGQQKYFAKNYKAMPRDGEDRQLFRRFIGAKYSSADVPQKMVRRALGYYGEGDYKKWMKKFVPDGSFSYLGRHLGGMSGIPGMNAVGSYAGNKLAKFVGFGDYSSNQIAGGNESQISVNRSDASGDIYVTRTEFVRNIVVSGSAGQPTVFEVREFGLNPGLGNSFPWLSQIAQNFTLYEFEGLMFQYKPLFSEDAGQSSNLGKVICATQYDPGAPKFRTSVEMENYDYANSGKPSCGLVHGVETSNQQQAMNMQYVRTGVSTRDLIFTDIGKFQLATEGIPLASGATTAIIGELWVAYRVKLSRAEIYQSLLGLGIGTDVLFGNSSAGQLATTTTFRKDTNGIGVFVRPLIGESTSMEVVFPVEISLGYYQYVVQFDSGATQFTTQTMDVPGAFVNCQYYLPGDQVPSGSVTERILGPSSPAGTTSNFRIVGVGYIYVDSPGLSVASFTVNVTGALTATTTWKLYVSQANGNVANALG